MASFRLHALESTQFAPLFELSDAELLDRGARRMQVDVHPGFPCRVSLDDAALGEEVLLLPFEHHAVDSPYRASGPIFVRRDAPKAQPEVDEVPAAIARRLISLRAYDVDHLMRAAEVVKGTEVGAALQRLFDDARIQRIDLHNAKPGCFAARATRA